MNICVSSYLHNSAKSYPNHIALSDNKKSISYADYQDQADRVSLAIVSAGIFKSPIAVLMDKSVESVTTFLGVAQTGNYYTVIDPKMPDTRISRIMDTFLPVLIICDQKNLDKAKSINQNSIIICYEEVIKESSITKDDICRIRNVENRIIDTDILYVLFTSGSTGVPKGVIITHRSVIDYIEWAADTFGFNHESIWGNQAPFYFDNSVLDIYSSLRGGGTMCIIPQMCFSFPIKLLEYVRDKRINTIFWVPTVLSRVADMGILDCCDIDCLKNVLFAGEVMPTRQLKSWISRLPNTRFANLYGPTEITVDCTYYIVDRELNDDESVPIGFPCRNSDVLVLNKENRLVDVNEKGELCVRGSSLSLGYYNNPEKTSQVFVQNPLQNLYEEKIYRTGDIVHYNERGEIIYDGRVDSQVKHTGHRIELGEIETAVSAIEGIQMNACLHKSDKDQLILFYSGNVSEDDIRKALTKLLPDYMLPNICNRLQDMPINDNGKIDRKKLGSMI